jgi:hypothetical protein
MMSTDINNTPHSDHRKFDGRMYAAALAYYGLPTDYKRTFKQKTLTDRNTGEILRGKDGKPRTTLVACKAAQESAQGNAVWVQVNRTFEGAAFNTSGDYKYPKKAANSDIQMIKNITTDFEYPPNPSIAHGIGRALAHYIVSQGLAAEELPVEESGAGCHIVLPIPTIETTPETAELWNKAVYEVVKTHIQPEFDRLVKAAGIVMDMGGFDISRVLSSPGTWRPYRPDKHDCDALKSGYLRRWLSPYVDGRYPERKENEKLATLIRDAYKRLTEEAQKLKEAPTTQRRTTITGDPQLWIHDYASNHPNTDRSALFHSLVSATYLKFGEGTVFAVEEQINELSGQKYNGRLRAEIERSLASVAKEQQVPTDNTGNETKKKQGKKGSTTEKKQSTSKNKDSTTRPRLLQIAEQATFIRTSGGALYARVPVNSHHEVVTINEHGSGFKRWLVYQYHTYYGSAPNSDAVSQTMASVLAVAEYEGIEAKVHTRIAEHNGNIYLDMADKKRQCIEITPHGWGVISCPPVYFRQPNGVLPLPTPNRQGTLEDIKQLVNVREERDFMLIIAWLLGGLHPKGPYAALNLNGERGSAKSKATAILRNIIDPNEAPHRFAPKDIQNLVIAAQNSMVIALDNLSSIPMWLSDGLCRLATGGGHADRELYTNDSEKIFNDRRPVLMNGIEDGIITQGDLLSRTMMVTLVPPREYLSEEEIDTRFQELHPGILGALLTATSMSLRERKNVRTSLPRMADFARWVIAAEPVLGWEPGTFATVFTTNQDNATSIIVESSPLARALQQFMHNKKEWIGHTEDLRMELVRYEVLSQSKTCPTNAKVLSGQLRRLAPTIRTQGIDIQILPRDENGSRFSINMTSKISCN